MPLFVRGRPARHEVRAAVRVTVSARLRRGAPVAAWFTTDTLLAHLVEPRSMKTLCGRPATNVSTQVPLRHTCRGCLRAAGRAVRDHLTGPDTVHAPAQAKTPSGEFITVCSTCGRADPFTDGTRDISWPCSDAGTRDVDSAHTYVRSCADHNRLVTTYDAVYQGHYDQVAGTEGTSGLNLTAHGAARAHVRTNAPLTNAYLSAYTREASARHGVPGRNRTFDPSIHDDVVSSLTGDDWTLTSALAESTSDEAAS